MTDPQKDYIFVEIRRIEIDKWCQGERQCSDPGHEFVKEWVKINAENFRTAWDDSLCQNCENMFDCGHNVVSACDDYNEKEDIE